MSNANSNNHKGEKPMPTIITVVIIVAVLIAFGLWYQAD